MNITFRRLQKSDFSNMLTWLTTPHVQVWFDPDVSWTLELVKQKYNNYVQGYKTVDGHSKPIQAFIIEVDSIPVGYIQHYKAHDFPRSKPLTGLPKNLAAFDMFIGNSDYLGKGIGSQALILFLDTFAKEYAAVFADPNMNNIAAIKTYEKAGFEKIKNFPETGEVWMLHKPLPIII